MFPIRDHNPSRRVPYVTIALIAANILIFLLQTLTIQDDPSLARHYADWAMVPAEVSQGDAYYSIFSSMFLHAGFMHIAGNMLFLWIYGDNLEDILGHVPFLAFYLVCGLLAAMAHILADSASPVPTVGASGAIAGVMGGYLLLFPKARIDFLLILVVFFRVFTLSAWMILGFWFAIQLVQGTLMDQSGGGVAYWAHAGGFVAGLILITPIWLRLGGTKFWDRTHGHPDHPPTSVPTRIPTVRRG